ncbi:hypothetical protein Ping_2469 [Psychromonas ingrahamii 37]|uniref:Uncharacterized protein n=1 Tax=Psychromonas ingrahamii (strain DSM 17664 / CCUG 51855 / 37) TaxID=357804 RepID=A1SXI5_PSYIN|nr:hypothetical protein [Psychromonas ingrahamii]ABM04200.1 hypothetical protein Ping_2469 [Psychromonas ingrahamii 37]
MCLTKEYFDGRDQFIEEQNKQGNLTHQVAAQELGVETSYLFDIGILTSRELNTATTNLTQLTLLGGLFFVESYQQIFISKTKLETLKKALQNWDNFVLELDIVDPEISLTGQLSVKNQKNVNFLINGDLFQHRLKFRIDDVHDEMSCFPDSDNSSHLQTVWQNFCECGLLIENNKKSPTNLEIATDADTIETLCASWHKLVQRYFRSKMHQIGFEHNLLQLKKEIEQSYSTSEPEWFPLTQYFSKVRPVRGNNDGISLPETEQEEKSVEVVTHKSIDEFGFIQPSLIENTTRRLRSLRESPQLQPGDVLLWLCSILMLVLISSSQYLLFI